MPFPGFQKIRRLSLLTLTLCAVVHAVAGADPSTGGGTGLNKASSPGPTVVLKGAGQ